MSILVRVRDDRMEATVEIARSDGEPFDVEAIRRALAEAGINYGVDDDACLNLAATVNQLQIGGSASLPVARGSVAQDGEDGRVEFQVEYDRNPVGLSAESGNIDFHEHGSFTPIAQDQVIARIALPTAGTSGRDVRGGELRPKPGKGATFKAGKGTKLEARGTELRATGPGDLLCTNELIEVIDVIRVPGNLDYTVGSIECESAVRVEGDVLPGFYIRAGGDVSIGGVVDAAFISSHGNVTIKQGVLAGSSIHATKIVSASHVRESFIETEGNVAILKESVNSTIVSGDSITIPAGGKVIGGRLFAQNRIVADAVGHPNGVATTLIAGVDAIKELKAAKAAAALNKAENAQARVGRIKDIAKPERRDGLDELLSRLARQKKNSAEELAQLRQEESSLTTCDISIKLIHPNVCVRIGPSEITVKEACRNVTFHYDAASHKLVQFESRSVESKEKM